MDRDSLIDRLRDQLALAPKLGYRVRLDLGEDGVILLDGTEAKTTVSDEDGEADTTLALTKDSLAKMLDGTLDPTFAYMSGKLKVSGSMGVALKLAGMLGD